MSIPSIIIAMMVTSTLLMHHMAVIHNLADDNMSTLLFSNHVFSQAFK